MHGRDHQEPPGGPGSCTGPSNDQKADRARHHHDRSARAGRGVNGKLLGSVNRAGIGDQVTYAGHPLYLFDQGPGQLTGEGWDEPSLPPWHGVWWLMAPSGVALAWTVTLTTTTVNNKTVLAVLMLTGIGWEPFPVYSYSGDTASKARAPASVCRRLASAVGPRDAERARFAVVLECEDDHSRRRHRPALLPRDAALSVLPGGHRAAGHGVRRDR